MFEMEKYDYNAQECPTGVVILRLTELGDGEPQHSAFVCEQMMSLQAQARSVHINPSEGCFE